MKLHKKLSNEAENKNQWQIKDIETRKISYFSVGVETVGKNSKPCLKNVILPVRKFINSLGERIIFMRQIDKIGNPKVMRIFSEVVKGGLTVLISVLIFFTVVQAGTIVKITPPSGAGEPIAKFYSLSEIYALIHDNNTSATEGSPALDWSSALEDTGYTLTDIYSALTSLIDPTKVLTGTTYLGTAGTMADNDSFILTASSSDQSVMPGYYSGGTLTGDADLVEGNIANGVNIFGVIGNLVAGYLFGSSDASQVLTSAGTGAGTYNADNLSVGNVRYGQPFGVSSTGAMSPYPNTPSGITGLNQTVCSDAGWTWVADSDYDGVSDDPVCVQPARDASGAKVWNTSVANDNTFIGNYGCSCDSDGDGIGTLNTGLTGTVSENAGYGDDAVTALAIADCKDGIRNLLSKAAVESFGYTVPE